MSRRIRNRRQGAYETCSACIATILFFLPVMGLAHHSNAVFYDRQNFGELQGVIIGIIWKNPHVRYSLRVVDESGESELWQLETNSVNSLSRLGVTKDIVKVGDQIKVYGILSRLGRKDMRVSNILMVDGNEVMLMPPINDKRRWTSEASVAADPTAQRQSVDKSIALATDIFRVWARGDGLESGPFALFNNESYPLTESAIEARKSWDPITDDPGLKCVPYGMPAAMAAPYPIEFVEKNDGNILMRIEEFDRERTIHMTGALRPENRSLSPNGYSTGYWDGATLVVETSHLSSPNFDKSGIPLSPSAKLTERFSIIASESRLDYQVTITDQSTFTEPVRLDKYWVWNPSEELKSYDCTLGVPVTVQ